MVAAGTLQAQTWYNRTYCSPGGLKICAAISATSYQVGSQWKVGLRVWNLFDGSALNGVSYSLTAIGLYHTTFNYPNSNQPTLADARIWTSATTWFSASDWSYSQGNDIANWSNAVGAKLDLRGGSTGQNQALVGCAVVDGVPPREPTCYPTTPYLELTFDVASNGFDLTSNGWYFRFHGQEVDGLTGCSLRVDEQYGVQEMSAEQTDACTAVEITTTTPEPVSMILLASGLAGVGGARLMRRRRKDEDITSA
jgi:hypothetical protein